MPEETLSTLLEQAISRELRSMLMHNQPPSREYHQFSRFLQDLENRRRQYTTNQPPVAKTYATTAKPVQRPQSPYGPSPTAVKPVDQPWRSTSQKSGPAPAQQHDPMDLSSTRRPVGRGYSPSRRETGACFRCGSLEHQIRGCPYPDTRQRVQIISSYEPRPESPSRGRVLELRSPSPSQTSSVKGASLE